MKYNLATLLFILTIFLGTSCNNEKKQAAETPQKTDSKTIPQTTESTNKKEVAFYVNDRAVYKSPAINRNINASIDDEIIHETGLINKMDEDPVLLEKIRLYKRNYIIAKIKGKVIKDYLANKQFTDEELKKHFDATKANYTLLKLVEITTNDKSTASEIQSRLKKGENLDDIISEIKKPEVKIEKKDIRETKRFNNYFSDFSVGSVSSLESDKNVYLIYQITDSRVLPFEEAKGRVRIGLINSTKIQAIKEYVENSKKEYNIKIKKVN